MLLTVNQISIVDGPSLEELILCLRLNHENRETWFTFKDFSGNMHRLKAGIVMLHTEDAVGELWSCELFFQPQTAFFIEKHISGEPFIFYSTRKRKGVVTSEKGLSEIKITSTLFIVHNSKEFILKKLDTTRDSLNWQFGGLMEEILF